MRPARSVGLEIGATLCLLILCAGGVAGAPTQGGSLIIGMDQEPPTLDPHASPSAVTYQIIANVTESLLYQTPSGEIVPWLASRYAISSDGTSFTLTLRTDASFSDGAPLNAEAVKWNLDRIVTPTYKAGVALTALTGYAGSTIVDDYTIRVNFKAPFAPFLTYLAGGWLGLISPRTTATQGPAVNQKPVGSGPFVISEYAPKDRIVFSRNPQYRRRAPWSDHAGPPYLEKIVWVFIPEAGTRLVTIQSDETQMISFQSAPAALLPRLESDKNLRVEKNPYPGVSRLWALNVKLPPTDDLRVRQALSFGINRAAFVESIYRGVGLPACAPLSRHTLDDVSLCKAYPYSPQKATQLLDLAGWKGGTGNIRQKDGKPLTLVINSINYGGGNAPEIELLQGQLLGLGIDAKIKSQARPPYYEDNYHCATNGPVMFLRDPDWNALYAVFGSANIGGNFNWSCYSSAEVDKLLQDGRAEFDIARRRAIYGRIERILLDQAVAIPLVNELSVWVMRSVVQGTKYNYSSHPILSDVYIAR